jgi:hypothetical protein
MDCRHGPVNVLLAKYDREQTTVTVWCEPLHLIRANYWIDPWNQGTCPVRCVLCAVCGVPCAVCRVPCAVCCVLCAVCGVCVCAI